jgi:hypothetical protein
LFIVIARDVVPAMAWLSPEGRPELVGNEYLGTFAEYLQGLLLELIP